MCRFAIWIIQQQIRPTLLLNIDYTGTKGTDLDILEAPNRTPNGILVSRRLTPSPMKTQWRIRRPTRSRFVCASVSRQDSRSAAPTRFPSRWTMRLRSARERPRWRVRPGLGAGGTGASGGGRFYERRCGQRCAESSRSVCGTRAFQLQPDSQVHCGLFVWSCLLATTSAGLLGNILRGAPLLATGSGAATGRSPPGCRLRRGY